VADEILSQVTCGTRISLIHTQLYANSLLPFTRALSFILLKGLIK